MKLVPGSYLVIFFFYAFSFGLAKEDASQYCFPNDFLFGTATAAAQVEGGYLEYGRTFSIWDTVCREYPNYQCSNVADDMIHRYESDIQLMAQMGLTSFRFSFSWSRVMTWDAEVQKMVPNYPGIQYYHRFIQTLRKYNIEPIITMYHWDLPQALEDNLSPKGWLNRNIVEHFVDYAKVLFHEYGNQVNLWATFNEPLTFILAGYEHGSHPPHVTGSDTAAYLAAHHVLLSHAYVVELFHAKFSHSPEKKISIALNCDYINPLDPKNLDDVKSAQDVLDFSLGWFLNPIVYGDYPTVMREKAGQRLPQFTAKEQQIIKGSYDVFMLNHYATRLSTPCDSKNSTKPCNKLTRGWSYDLAADHEIVPPNARLSSTDDGELNCKWFSALPEGYLDILRHLHAYNMTTDIFLTENGWCGNRTIDNLDQLWYHQTYLHAVANAMNEGIPIKGYSVWSFMDNYEWGSYKPRFGIHYVNYTSETGKVDERTYGTNMNTLQRIPRITAKWYKHVAQTKCIEITKDYATDANTNW